MTHATLGGALDHRNASSGIGGLVAGLAAANLLPMPPVVSLVVEVPLAIVAFQMLRHAQFSLPARLRDVALPAGLWRAIAGSTAVAGTTPAWPLPLRLAVLLLAIGSLLPVPLLGSPAALTLALMTARAARGRAPNRWLVIPAALLALAPLAAPLAVPDMLAMVTDRLWP